MRCHTFRWILAAGLVAGALPASAQWYVGIAGGKSNAKAKGASLDAQLLDLGFDDAASSFDKSDGMWRAFGGYRFNRYLAVEGAYTDLGRFRQRATVLPAGSLQNETRIDGPEINVVGMIPIWERLGAMVRVGAFNARVRSDFSASGSVQLIEGREQQRHRSTQAVYGAGLFYNVTPRVAARLEYARYDKLGESLVGGELDLRTWALGVQWMF